VFSLEQEAFSAVLSPVCGDIPQSPQAFPRLCATPLLPIEKPKTAWFRESVPGRVRVWPALAGS
jgi:hypothetical protein